MFQVSSFLFWTSLGNCPISIPVGLNIILNCFYLDTWDVSYFHLLHALIVLNQVDIMWMIFFFLYAKADIFGDEQEPISSLFAISDWCQYWFMIFISLEIICQSFCFIFAYITYFLCIIGTLEENLWPLWILVWLFPKSMGGFFRADDLLYVDIHKYKMLKQNV